MHELLYRDTPMRWEPVNEPTEQVLLELRQGDWSWVILEPGDGTRYELIVIWLDMVNPGVCALDFEAAQQGLLVTRLISGRPIGTALIGWFNHGGVAEIAQGNEWSAELLQWWCDGLLERLAPYAVYP